MTKKETYGHKERRWFVILISHGTGGFRFKGTRLCNIFFTGKIVRLINPLPLFQYVELYTVTYMFFIK